MPVSRRAARYHDEIDYCDYCERTTKMKRTAITIIAAGLLMLNAVPRADAIEGADAAPSNAPRASGPVETVKGTAVEVGHAVKETAIEVGHAAKETAVKVGRGAKEAAVEVGHGVKNAAVEVGHAARDTAHRVGEGVKSAASSGPSQPPPPKQD